MACDLWRRQRQGSRERPRSERRWRGRTARTARRGERPWAGAFATEDTQGQLTKLGWSVWVGGGLFLCGMLATFMHEFRAIPNFSEVTTG